MNKKEVMRGVQYMRVKSRHTAYINGEIDYEDYKEYINYVIIFFRPEYTGHHLDTLWQNLNFASKSWEVAREEIFQAIAS